MAKFSISEDDEEAPLIYRRRRFTGPASQSLISVQRSRRWVVTEEDDELIPMEDVEFDSHSYEEEEDDEFEAAGEDSGNEHRGVGRGEAEGNNQQQQMAYSPVSGTAASPVFRNASETVLQALLTKHGALDCRICHDQLFTPVLQCEDGDIMCSSCCSKMQSKCPFCCMSIGVSNNRCQGLEKFIESISSISCKYAWSGCKKTMPYSKKSEHERMCPCATCYCPYPSCHFGGPSKKLYLHFGIEHAASSSTTFFTYNTTFSTSIETNQKCLFLQEQNERVIFILNHQFHENGKRVFSVDFVGGLGTLLKSCFEYQLTAKSKETSLSMQSVPEMYTKWSDSTPRKNYLTVPSGFVDYSTGHLSLSVCIKKGVSSEIEAEAAAAEVGNEDDDGGYYGHVISGVQMVLTNPYVLHCPLCLEPLWTRVFQCEKGGHLACSSCCSKLKKKCRICYPIGNGCKYIRCRGLESIVNSLLILCKNAQYGCDKTMYYPSHVKGVHEDKCPFDLCFCPYPSCPYTGISTNLYRHFRIQHAASITRFSYKTTFSLCVDINQKHVFLQEVHDGAIFILNHQVQEHGRAFYVDRIGPASNNKFFMYQLTAKTMEEASASATLKSVPETHTNWSQHPPTNNYLTIPPDFVGYKGLLSLSICITKGFDAYIWIVFGDHEQSWEEGNGEKRENIT